MNIPDYCFSLLNTSINPKTGIGKVITIRAMVKGYYPTKLLATQEEVDKMNEFPDTGEPIDKATVRAMESASMFGWDTYPNWLKSFRKFEKKNENINSA